jgi:Fe-S-cluster containining protein
MQGLLVTENEYERVFEGHAHALEVTQSGRLKRLTSKAGPCPNWQGACTVYEDRPMECRLFPFTVSVVAATAKTVHITAHDRVDCPQKAVLLPRETVARSLIEAFAREAYGRDRTIRISFERGLGRMKARLLRLGLRLRWFKP